ncbi:Hypothetical predicted protein [Olea europaea subsp. europaea]|uniref:Uncharacterized protein n=1 Tax=Olea europaea subsp. europaea TaxID=158383 RepID=A0A8S0PTB4_OLEEU|nr:Hypothetical predicted protein [Olea europaea subsp. europaea]
MLFAGFEVPVTRYWSLERFIYAATMWLVAGRVKNYEGYIPPKVYSYHTNVGHWYLVTEGLYVSDHEVGRWMR